MPTASRGREPRGEHRRGFAANERDGLVTADGRLLTRTRALRAFGDGMTSVVLAVYLTGIGLSDLQIGVVITLMLLGSAALTLAVGVKGSAVPRKRILSLASILMIATGLGFTLLTGFWPLAVVGLLGTLNPSGGDVSVFLPTEQALLAEAVPAAGRTALFARYSLVGTLLAALGAAGAGGLGFIGSGPATLRFAFVVYTVIGVVLLVRYRSLSSDVDHHTSSNVALGPSRAVVYRLAALFSLDSFGGGFALTALLVLWLERRHGISLAVSGVVFFGANVLSAFSTLLAPVLAERIGLIRTMAYTHLPANVFLVTAALVPSAELAIGLLLARSAFSMMDVPARNSYVMAVVTPAERPAAASITNVPRSLATALPPVLAGWMLSQTTFGWPLVIAGTLKAIYDLLLLHQFRSIRPPEEEPGK